MTEVGDLISINGSLVESGIATYGEVVEDLKNVVSIRDGQALEIKELIIDLPIPNEIPATTTFEHVTVQLLQVSKASIVHHDDEDLIYQAQMNILAHGTSVGPVLIEPKQKSIHVTYRKGERPVLYRKELILGILSSHGTPQTAYYRIMTKAVKLSEKKRIALLSDISDTL
ncbi:unnamed protein product [marine sediment metagenome]|uniref:Uncharacterized protein n=1 Tax=marine sediment metagenome TaxID=412755 RepID=X1CCK8_9ZZZZ